MARLTRDELIDRVRRISAVQGTDEELQKLAAEINANVPYPDITDLIYDEEESMTPEEIIDKALACKPRTIQLPSSTPDPEKR